jgi:hypothetical protein
LRANTFYAKRGDEARKGMPGPVPQDFWDKIGFKIAAGHADAPADHIGGQQCQCNICKLPAERWVRVFRRPCAHQKTVFDDSVWPFDTRFIVNDPLHCGTAPLHKDCAASVDSDPK